MDFSVLSDSDKRKIVPDGVAGPIHVNITDLQKRIVIL